jgi:hypothetical protein
MVHAMQRAIQCAHPEAGAQRGARARLGHCGVLTASFAAQALSAMPRHGTRGLMHACCDSPRSIFVRNVRAPRDAAGTRTSVTAQPVLRCCCRKMSHQAVQPNVDELLSQHVRIPTAAMPCFPRAARSWPWPPRALERLLAVILRPFCTFLSL